MNVSDVLDLAALQATARVLFSVPLRPAQGARFQPTGFPDLGAATFVVPQEDGSGTQALLVESPQSMGNRLEAVCWDIAARELIHPLADLSYVRVLDKSGGFLTSSVLEAHRLNSHYIESANGGSFTSNLRLRSAPSKID